MLTNIKDLDEALMNKLVSTAFLGEATPVPIPVYYINPEEEFVIESFPSIIVYRIGETRDGERVFLPKFKNNYVYDDEGILDQLSQRESPLPLNFWYNIRLYYEYNEDGAEMNLMMLKNFPPRPKPCYITIGEEDYDFVFIYHSLLSSGKDNFGSIKFNKETNNRRIFCDQYLYYCCTDLDIFDAEVVKTVKTVSVRERGF